MQSGLPTAASSPAPCESPSKRPDPDGDEDDREADDESDVEEIEEAHEECGPKAMLEVVEVYLEQEVIQICHIDPPKHGLLFGIRARKISPDNPVERLGF